MTVAITPNHHVALIFAYGNVEDAIKVPGISIDPKIKEYIIDQFGYNPNFMGLVATMLGRFCSLFCICVFLQH
uniref:Uncharacterized protein n=1 Tax=Solanum lycopersicum TaxID=4081 RepID=K4DFE2_SOLLC